MRFAPTLTTYVPVAQAPERITRLVLDKIPLRWVLRTDREATDLIPAVRQAVLAVDPTQPAADFARMSDVLGRWNRASALQHADAHDVQRPRPCTGSDRCVQA